MEESRKLTTFTANHPPAGTPEGQHRFAAAEESLQSIPEEMELDG